MKKIAAIFTAVAMMATSAASLGCIAIFIDEPKAPKAFTD